jgi:hypothetical protein
MPRFTVVNAPGKLSFILYVAKLYFNPEISLTCFKLEKAKGCVRSIKLQKLARLSPRACICRSCPHAVCDCGLLQRTAAARVQICAITRLRVVRLGLTQ